MDLQRIQKPELRHLRRGEFALVMIAPDQELLRDGYDIYPTLDVLTALKGLLTEDKECYWHRRVEDVAQTYGVPFDSEEKQRKNWFAAEFVVGSGIHDLVDKYRRSINGRHFAGSDPNFPLYDYRFHADETNTQEQHDLLNIHHVLGRISVETDWGKAQQRYAKFPDAAADSSPAKQGTSSAASLVRA